MSERRVNVNRPDLYLRSSTSVLHLRATGPGVVGEDGLSATFARCGWTNEVGAMAIPTRLFPDGEYRLCQRCAVIEP